jgi:CTP synthase
MVCDGVFGSGIISSSLGTILKAHNLLVTSIKIDPYLNIGNGLLGPRPPGCPAGFTSPGGGVT